MHSGALANWRLAFAVVGVLVLFSPRATKHESVLLAQGPRGDSIKLAMGDFVAPYVSSKSFSGFVLVNRGGERLVERGYGMADYQLGVPVGSHTRFRIASVTKSFTAAAVLLLVDRGVVDLDQPVGRYLSEFPHGAQITVRHLLAHESGLPNYYFDLDDYPTLSRQHYERPADVVALVQGMELRSEPGALRAYNNMNYTVLAWLIEEMSGLTYQEFLRRELLAPSGLDETGYESEMAELIPNLARGYEPVGVSDFQNSRYFDHSITVGAGSMYSTAGDLARWATALTGGGLLRERSLEAALDYAWSEQELHGHQAFVASGWDNVGYSIHLIYVPDEQLTVVVLCNLNIAQVVGEIAQGLTAIVLSEEPQRMDLKPGTLPTDSLQALAGLYRFGDDFYMPGGVLDLEVHDGWLVDVGREPEAALIPLADGGFLYRPVWAKVRFIADEQGTVNELTFYDRFTAKRETGKH